MSEGRQQVLLSEATSGVSAFAAQDVSCNGSAQSASRSEVAVAQSTADTDLFVAGRTTRGTAPGDSGRSLKSETGAVAQSTAPQNASSAAGVRAGTWFSLAVKAGALVHVPKIGRALESSRAGGNDDGAGSQDNLVMPAKRSAAEQSQGAAPAYGALKGSATESGQQQEQPAKSLRRCAEPVDDPANLRDFNSERAALGLPFVPPAFEMFEVRFVTAAGDDIATYQCHRNIIFSEMAQAAACEHMGTHFRCFRPGAVTFVHEDQILPITDEPHLLLLCDLGIREDAVVCLILGDHLGHESRAEDGTT